MHALHDWLGMSLDERKKEIKDLLTPGVAPPRDYIQLVKAPHTWGIFASIGPRYRYAVFGRDSIETAEDILDTHPELVHDIILTLCRLQGRKLDTQSEEEPGKIHHEYRTKYLNGHLVPDESQHILYDLQHVWGGLGTDEMTYFASFDATPLFVRLVGKYVVAENASILDETITGRDGVTRSVRDCVHAALLWLSGKLAGQQQGMLAYRRLSPIGILNQCWKDNETSHIHEDGSLPNYNEPVVSIELQGLAYDALLTGAQFELGTAEECKKWREQATTVQQNTLATLWMEDRQYFAQGYDIVGNGGIRQIRTITSDPAALLDSGLLHDLPEDQRIKYINAIVKVALGPDMLTNVGIRCRSVEHWDLVDYIDYHGPNAIWPKETFDIAKGLRRAGLNEQADDLERRIRSSLIHAGDFTEFFYVSRDGKVWYDRDEAMAHFRSESHSHEIAVPEPGQAWTIAAALNIASRASDTRRAHTPPAHTAGT